MVVKIRPIVFKDAVSYRLCWDAIAKERRYLTEYEAPPLASVRKAFRKILRNKTPFLVAVDGERVVGFVVVYRWGLPSLSHLVDLGMGLLPEYREIGLGTKLTARVLKMCRGKFDSVHLTVFEKNKRARKLYKNMGFELCGRIKKAVKGLAYGTDDLLAMQKQIRR